jgi:allantoate deiminase
MDADEVIRRCRVLAGFSEEPVFTTRTFLSAPMRDAQRQIREWMEAAGMSVRVDAAGNMRGVSGRGRRALMIGSHLDTVPHAGAFDGILGVMMGIALVEARPNCAIEVVAFSEEEGVRFGIPFIGSRALVGDPVMHEPVLEAIRGFGLDPSELGSAVLDDVVRGFLEFHIEQGPVLDQLNVPLGVVESIVGLTRMTVVFHGHANHAGTTPMAARRDALAGAAEWVGAVECVGEQTPGLVATVGKLLIDPNVTNAVAGLVRASLDVRHADDDVRQEAAASICSRAARIAERRGLQVEFLRLLQQPAVRMDTTMTAMLDRAAEQAGHKAHRMSSGAGHDAMILDRKVPVAMLFVRTPGGVSHHPDEDVRVEDVAAALDVGIEFLDAWEKADG